MKTTLSRFGILAAFALLCALVINMPRPVESDPGLLLRPYFGLARLAAATDHWQSIVGVNNTDDALTTISFPDYDIIPTDGGAIRIPKLVIANPIDLASSYYKRPDPQGRRDNGGLLLTFLLPRADIEDEADRLACFMYDVGKTLEQMLALADTLLDPDDANSKYHQNVLDFELAIAAGECGRNKLVGVLNADETEHPDPLSVMTCAFVAHWL